MADLVASQEVAGESAGSGVTALDAGHRITGPSPATRPDSECGSPASRTAALLAGSDELPAGCQTQSGPDNRAPSDDGNAADHGRTKCVCGLNPCTCGVLRTEPMEHERNITWPAPSGDDFGSPEAHDG